jgi:hypothetical protein
VHTFEHLCPEKNINVNLEKFIGLKTNLGRFITELIGIWTPTKYCWALLHSVFIDYDGLVLPCCMMQWERNLNNYYYPLGNIYDETLLEIEKNINANLATHHFREIFSKMHKRCRGCTRHEQYNYAYERYRNKMFI